MLAAGRSSAARLLAQPVILPSKAPRGRAVRPRPSLSATEGSASEAADKPFGISNGKFQISNLRYEICNLRFRARRGQPIGRSGERASRGSLVCRPPFDFTQGGEFIEPRPSSSSPSIMRPCGSNLCPDHRDRPAQLFPSSEATLGGDIRGQSLKSRRCFQRRKATHCPARRSTPRHL